MIKAILKSIVFIIVALSIVYFELIPGMNKDTLFDFYLLDYIGIFFILTAQSLLKGKNKIAFVIYIIGLVANGFLGYVMNSVSIVLFSIYSTVIFVENWIQWNNDEKNEKASSF